MLHVVVACVGHRGRWTAGRCSGQNWAADRKEQEDPVEDYFLCKAGLWLWQTLNPVKGAPASYKECRIPNKGGTMIRLGLWVRFVGLLSFESNFEKQGEPGDRVEERSISRGA